MVNNKFFIVNDPKDGVARTLAICSHLQEVIEYVKNNKYVPFDNLKVYMSTEIPLNVVYVDGKIMFS